MQDMAQGESFYGRENKGKNLLHWAVNSEMQPKNCQIMKEGGELKNYLFKLMLR